LSEKSLRGQHSHGRQANRPASFHCGPPEFDMVATDQYTAGPGSL
jgi:hypothetical protein